MSKNPNIVTSFFRYNIVALIATAFDFLSFIILLDYANIWYVAATFISALIGGAVAFTMNRNWVFKRQNKRITPQIIKYIISWGGSILLNTLGLYILVENTNINELTSKIIIAVLVGICYNFIMSRFVIFK